MSVFILGTSLLQEIENIEAGLTAPHLCLRSSNEAIKACLLSGYSVGVYSGNALVAFSLFYNNEYGCGFVEKCYVAPSYRGRGMLKRLLRTQNELVKEANIHTIYSLCSEGNIASYKSFVGVGYKKLQETEVEGYKRAILKYEVSS